MKLKLILILLITLGHANAFSQVSSLINNFGDAYVNEDVKNYIYEGERIVDQLGPEEKNTGRRVLDLFKLLTGQQQSISNGAFNKAMDDIGMTSVLYKEMNTNLNLIYFKIGTKRTYLVYNRSAKGYTFNLKGSYKAATSTSTNNFNGGIFGNHVRVIQYTATPYNYSVISVKEIPSF